MIGSASIKQNTNKLVSSSLTDWKGIREGSFFRFKKDSNTYIISKTESLFYLIEFIKLEDRKIKIIGNTDININLFDNVTISFKEWELQTILSIKNPGEGFKNGEILTINGGKPILNIQDNLTETAKIRIENTNENGAITKLSIADKGRYYIVPDKIIKLGTAELELQFKNCENRRMIDRDVEKIEFDGTNTIITLNYNLPKEVEFGKIGVDKWIAYLSSNYLETTRINESYEITRDFTPHLSLPKMSKNSSSIDSVFNQAMLILEKKIKELEEKIK